MGADFAKKKLYYPASIRSRERNDSFAAPENFVVFECVHRLLKKGYRPEHIELEKQLQLGHGCRRLHAVHRGVQNLGQKV